jgi:GDP-D-mannose 3', 5'-epimerase
MQSKAVVLGGEGFIGGHLCERLVQLGYDVTSVDLKISPYWPKTAREIVLGDLRSPDFVAELNLPQYDYIFQLAADMGGAGFIFTGENDSDIMHNSASINLNVLHSCSKATKTKIFYSSSACIYPERNQLDPENPMCTESSAYPAEPDSEYGWEKLFSERLYAAYQRNYGLRCYVARFHNIYGPFGTYEGGREKAPAAVCRKVITSMNGEVEIWGDGLQTRSFLYIDDCLDAVLTFVAQDRFFGPVNIGSEEMVSINNLAKMAISFSEKKTITIRNVEGPTGVRGRNSDNAVIERELGWSPRVSLREGLGKTYEWIQSRYPSL